MEKEGTALIARGRLWLVGVAACGWVISTSGQLGHFSADASVGWGEWMELGMAVGFHTFLLWLLYRGNRFAVGFYRIVIGLMVGFLLLMALGYLMGDRVAELVVEGWSWRAFPAILGIFIYFWVLFCSRSVRAFLEHQRSLYDPDEKMRQIFSRHRTRPDHGDQGRAGALPS